MAGPFKRALPCLLTVITLGTFGACDSLSGTSERRQAEVAIDAVAAAGSVSVVTSTVFAFLGGGEVALVEADTTVVALPFRQNYTLDEPSRFFIRVSPAVEGDTASVRMDVKIDGKPWFNEQSVLGFQEPGFMTFIYRFTQSGL